MNAIIGQNFKLGTDEQVIIDCGPLIDSTTVPIPNVQWYFNNLSLLNESTPNVVISQDKRHCIITETLLPVGGQLGNGGNYTCEVCNDISTCMSNSTIIAICG